MSYREVAHNSRSVFRQTGFNKTWIKELRKTALKFLPPEVIAKVPPPYFSEEEEAAFAAKYRGFSDEERKNYKAPPSEYRAFSVADRAAYAAIEKSLEWNLTIDGDIGATGDYAFFFTATASDSVLTSSQQSAAALLYATLEALEKEALSDRLTQNILDALGGLDADAEAKGKKFPPGRMEGATSASTDHIFELANEHRSLTAKGLFFKADKSIIGDMPQGTFGNHVIAARKKYPKEKKPKK
jgi:hypothetical protein